MTSDAPINLVLAVGRVLFVNGQATEQTVAAAERLGRALGLRARIAPRWGELQLVAGDEDGTVIYQAAADAGLVINPDGAINQLEGGIVQAVSWALKEGVRLDTAGISSRDWESYPVLRFSEVPEIAVELVGAVSDNPPLGVGEASGGPTVAAIGNVVAHALGARLRDLPLTRERVMAALLKA